MVRKFADDDAFCDIHFVTTRLDGGGKYEGGSAESNVRSLSGHLNSFVVDFPVTPCLLGQ
jgi:hypothetical protein